MLIQLVNLFKEYHNGQTPFQALKDISLSIAQGEYVALTGPSGSGKSTLLNIIAALDRASAGKYFYTGRDLAEYSTDELAILRRQSIGFIFQNFNLIPRLSVLENVEMPLVYQGIASNKRKEAALNCLAMVGLVSKQNNQPMELSGGERQRVAIARSLITAPDILIADEPTGNLDTQNSKEIMAIFEELHQKGVTIILVTHEADIAAYAKRIICLRDGQIEKDSGNTLQITQPSSNNFPTFSARPFQLNLRETIRLAIISLWANRLRSLLMLTGMIIAVTAVIISLAIGEAGRKIITQEIETFGSNTVWVYRDWSERSKKNEADYYQSSNEISNQDLKILLDSNRGIRAITPKINFSGQARYNGKQEDALIVGTTPSLLLTSNGKLEKGRFLNQFDLINREKVCVLSAEINEKLVGNQAKIGEFLYINNERFLIVGLLRKEDRAFLEMIGSVKKGRPSIYAPLDVVQNWLQTQNIDVLEASLFSLNDSQVVAAQLKQTLERLHQGRASFVTDTLQQYMQTSNVIMGILSLVLGSIAGISLLVGGLGIMNIMLVSVTERTREIGIRKTIGATARNITTQFLVESAVVGVIGGTVGIILGLIGIGIVQLLFQVRDILSLKAIVVAFLCSLITGLLSGVYPAKRASTLEPAETLRWE